MWGVRPDRLGSVAPVVVLQVAAALLVGCGRAAPVGNVPPSPSGLSSEPTVASSVPVPTGQASTSVLASSARTQPTPAETAPPVASSARENFNCDPPSASLPPRAMPSVAYDPLTAQTLLFGGSPNNSSVYCDTWAWTGGSWMQLHPAHHPSARRLAYMAFDYQSGSMLLYGGEGAYLDFSSDKVKKDAWSWDGTDWRLLADSPSPALPTGFGTALGTGFGMASAAKLGVFLLFVGDSYTTITRGGIPEREALLDAYHWTGASWSLASAAGPAERIEPGFSYDPGLGAFLLFGGVFPGPGAGCDWGPTDMRTWDGQSWAQVNPTGPRPCGGTGSMTYDSARRMMVWFGVDGTWAWDDRQWTQLATAAQSPPWGEWGTLTYDQAHQQVLLTGMLYGDGTSSRTYVWDGAAWTAY
jgi:hypothetical protein